MRSSQYSSGSGLAASCLAMVRSLSGAVRSLAVRHVKVIDRYLIREFTYSYVICVLIMITLYVVLDLFANIDEFAEAGHSTGRMILDILRYYGYHGFLYFAQVAGMITLVAACFTLARLHRNNELTGFLAGGVSLYRIALPIIAMSLVFNALWVVDQELIIPRIAQKLSLRHDEMSGRRSFDLWFLRDKEHNLLSAMRYHPREKTMEELIVMVRDDSGQLISKISAYEATWDKDQQGWKLIHGKRYARSTPKTDFVVAGKMGAEPLAYYSSDWRPEDLLLRQAAGWTWLLSLRQLNALLKKSYLVPDINEVVAARHVRLTQPLVNMLLVLLGLPFFLNREPHNVLLSVGMCLLLAILCFMSAFVAQNIAGTTSSPALAAWLPIMIFGPIAAILMENVKT